MGELHPQAQRGLGGERDNVGSNMENLGRTQSLLEGQKEQDFTLV